MNWLLSNFLMNKCKNDRQKQVHINEKYFYVRHPAIFTTHLLVKNLSWMHVKCDLILSVRSLFDIWVLANKIYNQNNNCFQNL